MVFPPQDSLFAKRATGWSSQTGKLFNLSETLSLNGSPHVDQKGSRFMPQAALQHHQVFDPVPLRRRNRHRAFCRIRTQHHPSPLQQQRGCLPARGLRVDENCRRSRFGPASPLRSAQILLFSTVPPGFAFDPRPGMAYRGKLSFTGFSNPAAGFLTVIKYHVLGSQYHLHQDRRSSRIGDLLAASNYPGLYQVLRHQY